MPKPNVREQLIDAGLRILPLHGFNGCAVQDITVAAGVPKGSFYNHFESKDALALEVLEQFWQEVAERRALLGDVTIDPVTRLQRHFKSLSDAVVSQEFKKGCLIGNFSAEMTQNSNIKNRLAEIYTIWGKKVASCIKEAAEIGRVHSDLPVEDIASFLLNAWEGAVLRSKVEQQRKALDQFEQVIFTMFFK